jgi:hypothetical protein
MIALLTGVRWTLRIVLICIRYTFKNLFKSGMVAYICNPGIRRPTQKDHEFKASLGYIVRLFPMKMKKKLKIYNKCVLDFMYIFPFGLLRQEQQKWGEEQNLAVS